MAKIHDVVPVILLTCAVRIIATVDSSPRSKSRKIARTQLCPPWMAPSTCSECNSGNCSNCKCGSSVGGLVKCNETTHEVMILACYCMSQSKILDETIVGSCPYSCSREYRTTIPSQLSQLDKFTCFDQKRTGQLCGNCIPDYAPPVYSYSIACVECTKYQGNWVKFVAIAFLPLTLFYFIIIAFRISAVAPKLQCYILVSQVVATPSHARFVYTLQAKFLQNYKVQSKLVQVGISMFSLWNLDFFRSIYHPFCLHPNLSSLGIVALDYLVAVYPLLLVITTYGFLEIYNRSSFIQRLMRPIYKCCFYFRKEWDIKQSLISVFATFILLSYVKFLNTSFDLLLPAYTYDMNGKEVQPSFLYYNGSVDLFGREHKPYAALAIIMMFVFNAVPLTFLYLYPCYCFQKLLNQFKSRSLQSVHIFVDVFLSNFRTKPVDCRYFAALYLTLRIVNLMVFSFTFSRFYYPIATLYMLMAALVVAIFQPHKRTVYNKLDGFFFIVVALGYIGAGGYGLSPGETPFNELFMWIVATAASIPVLYITILIISWAIPHRIKHRMELCFNSIWQGQQHPSLDGDHEFMEATDYQRSRPISESTNSEYTALQDSVINHKRYSYQTAY